MTPFRFSQPGEEALVMGIINLSPESFYGASRCGTLEQALHVAEKMILTLIPLEENHRKYNLRYQLTN